MKMNSQQHLKITKCKRKSVRLVLPVLERHVNKNVATSLKINYTALITKWSIVEKAIKYVKRPSCCMLCVAEEFHFFLDPRIPRHYLILDPKYFVNVNTWSRFFCSTVRHHPLRINHAVQKL